MPSIHTSETSEITSDNFLDRLVDLKELCRRFSHLGFNDKAVYNLVYKKDLPHFRFQNRLYFDPVDVNQWLKDQLKGAR